MSQNEEPGVELAVPSLAQPHDPDRLSAQERAALEGHAAAYALDALPAGEAAAFERHLATCALCRRLAAEFGATAGRLATAVAPAPAAPRLRARLLAAAERDLAPSTVAPPLPRVQEQRRPQPWFQRLGATGWLAAALLLCSVGLGVWNAALLRQAQTQRALLAEYESALAAAAEGRVVVLAPTEAAPGSLRQGRLALIVAPTSGESRLIVTGLPPAPAERTYQLWLIAGGLPQDAGIFLGAAQAVETVPVRGDPARAEVVAVTVEPRGGSRAPTTQPIFTARL